MYPPDLNHNGKRDPREYYDDLGGAYYFQPPGLDKPPNLPFWFRRNKAIIGPLVDLIFWLIFIMIINFIF